MTTTITEQFPINKLKTWPGNYRKGDIDAIAESIRANGWYGTIVAHEKTRRVIAGNHRLQAAQQLDIKEVPVYWVNGNEEKLRRILIADNRTSDLATNDDHAITEILSDLAESESGLYGTGYNTDDLDQMIKSIETTFAKSVPQPRLDQRNPITCPNCDHQFTP